MVEQLLSTYLVYMSLKIGYLSENLLTNQAILFPTSKEYTPRQASKRLRIFFKLYQIAIHIYLFSISLIRKQTDVSFIQLYPRNLRKKGSRLFKSPETVKLPSGFTFYSIEKHIFSKYQNWSFVSNEYGLSFMMLNSYFDSFDSSFSPCICQLRHFKSILWVRAGIFPFKQIHFPYSFDFKIYKFSNSFSAYD